MEIRERIEMFPRSWINNPSFINHQMESFGATNLGQDGASSLVDTDTESGGICRMDRHFRLMTYNMLTDNCIPAGSYLYCPADIRYMDNRHDRILAEVNQLNPEVVCFQEVSDDHFRSRLELDMEQHGYRGCYMPTEAGRTGLATFWKSKCFNLVQQKQCLLHALADQYIQVHTVLYIYRFLPAPYYIEACNNRLQLRTTN